MAQYNFETWQNKLQYAYRNYDHIALAWSTHDLQAVIDEDGELVDVCIEGAYLGEIISQEFWDEVQQRVNEL